MADPTAGRSGTTRASPDDFPDPDAIVIPPPNKSQKPPRKKTVAEKRLRTARVLRKVHDARDKERPDRRQRAITPTGLNAPREGRPIPLRERYGARGNAAYGATTKVRRTGQGQGQTRGRRTAPSVPDPDSEIVASLTPAERDDSYNAPMYPSQEAKELLFPWLAQGFIPQVTPGTGAQCGVYALYGSWMAACEWYNSQSISFPTQNDDGTPITVKDFNDLLNSDEYTQRAVQIARRMYANDSAAALDAAVREAEAKSWLQIEQVNLLLQMVNEKYKTDFDLGYVTQGHQFRYDSRSKLWDKTYGQATTCTTTYTSGNRPMIFIWNNAADATNSSHKSGISPHYESFGPVKNPQNIDQGERSRKLRVENWGIGQGVADLFNVGSSNASSVYVVGDVDTRAAQQWITTTNASTNDPVLPLTKGAFLIAEAALGLYRIMRFASDGSASGVTRGVVASSNVANVATSNEPTPNGRWPHQLEFGFDSKGRAAYLQTLEARFQAADIQAVTDATGLPYRLALIHLAHSLSAQQVTTDYGNGMRVVYHAGAVNTLNAMRRIRDAPNRPPLSIPMIQTRRSPTPAAASPTQRGTSPTPRVRATTKVVKPARTSDGKRSSRKKKRSSDGKNEKKPPRKTRIRPSIYRDENDERHILEFEPKVEKIRMFRVFTPGRTKYTSDGLVTLSPIDGFEVRPGELVIDCRTVRRNNTVEVANLAGRRGRVRADNLQLIENPWRFNDYEPKHDPPRTTPLTLNKTTMHFMNSQSDPRLIEGWLKLCDKQADEPVEWNGLAMRIVILNERLPLVRMKEGKAETRINIGTDQEQPGWAAVEQGELVRIHAHANNYNTIFRAIDIEGRATRIRDRNIEHFARKFPFGVAKARDNYALENVAGKEYRDVARMFKKIMRQMTDAETVFSKKRALKEAREASSRRTKRRRINP